MLESMVLKYLGVGGGVGEHGTEIFVGGGGCWRAWY